MGSNEPRQGSFDGGNASTAIERIFRVRSRVITGFALAVPLVEGLGSRRWIVVATAALIALPYNLFLERETARTGRVPAYVPWCDQVVSIGATVAVPAIWTPILAVMVATLALAATVFDVRRVIGPTILGLALVVATGALTQDAVVTVTGAVAFTGSAAMAVLGVSAVTRHRMSLESENRELVANIDAVVWALEPGRPTYRSLSPAASRILGIDRDELLEIDGWMSHVVADDRPTVAAARTRAWEAGERTTCDYRMVDAHGRTVQFHEIVSCDAAASRKVLRGVAVDVTARREAEADRALYAQVVENLETGIVVVTGDAEDELVVVASNPSACRIFGRAEQDMTGALLGSLLPSGDPSIVEQAGQVSRGGPGAVVTRVSGLGIDRGRTFSVRVFGLPDDAVGVAFEDVTEATMVATALRRQALHDGLTGLPNRTLLRDRLRHSLAEARRRDERVALILLDLNHFKDVNDALGHQYGDRLLIAFSRRLQALLRECDTICRLGGDEFALLLTDATTTGAARVVRKVIEAMQEPFELEGTTVQTTASIGVAMFPDHAEDADLLTQRADVAMYDAKRHGGGWSLYSPQQDQSSIERLRLLSELHHQLDDPTSTDLTLHFQPILDLSTDAVNGAEALLRWQHPDLGSLNPELVVELAELSGLIQPLARRVSRQAMGTAAGWRERGHEIRVAVNLSARNLYDRHLVEWIQATLDDIGLPARLLKCELTESQVMDDPVVAMTVISQLRDIGVTTAIDDFGTGYSSLAYLRRLPVDEIKIDKSFVTSMLADPTDMTIVRTIIDLAHNLDMSVLAEGVEDEATCDALRGFGCDRIQGHHIGRPMPAHDLEALLRTRFGTTLAVEN